jgi:hypothetical protein
MSYVAAFAPLVRDLAALQDRIISVAESTPAKDETIDPSRAVRGQKAVKEAAHCLGVFVDQMARKSSERSVQQAMSNFLGRVSGLQVAFGKTGVKQLTSSLVHVAYAGPEGFLDLGDAFVEVVRHMVKGTPASQHSPLVAMWENSPTFYRRWNETPSRELALVLDELQLGKDPEHIRRNLYAAKALSFLPRLGDAFSTRVTFVAQMKYLQRTQPEGTVASWAAQARDMINATHQSRDAVQMNSAMLASNSSVLDRLVWTYKQNSVQLMAMLESRMLDAGDDPKAILAVLLTGVGMIMAQGWIGDWIARAFMPPDKAERYLLSPLDSMGLAGSITKTVTEGLIGYYGSPEDTFKGRAFDLVKALRTQNSMVTTTLVGLADVINSMTLLIESPSAEDKVDALATILRGGANFVVGPNMTWSVGAVGLSVAIRTALESVRSDHPFDDPSAMRRAARILWASLGHSESSIDRMADKL